MDYLLDTHTFLWMAGDPDFLSKRVFEIVSSVQNGLHLSAASGWEIALLYKLDRIDLPDDPGRFVPEAMLKLSVSPINIGFTTAIAAATLPLIHRDPFDRIIIAEALKGDMTILTKDRKMVAYGVSTLW